MARKAICKICKREIDTQNESHYKFGRNILCYVESSEDCLLTYAGEHFKEKGDGMGRYNGDVD